MVGHVQGPLTQIEHILAYRFIRPLELDIRIVAQHPQWHMRIVVVLQLNVQEEGVTAGSLLHAGEEIGAAGLNALLLGFEQVEVLWVDIQAEQKIGEIDRDLAQYVLADEVFFSHGYSITGDGNRCGGENPG